MSELHIWNQTERAIVVRIAPQTKWTGRLFLGSHDGNLSDQVYVLRTEGTNASVYTLLGATMYPRSLITVSDGSLKLERADGKDTVVMTYVRFVDR